jgi:hypothetical protein
VRPLAISTTNDIAAAMGWSRPYTLGVLRHWKMASVYCQAVVCHDQRITLDGAPAEPVGAEAKDLAAKHPGAAVSDLCMVAGVHGPAAKDRAAPPTDRPPTGCVYYGGLRRARSR